MKSQEKATLEEGVNRVSYKVLFAKYLIDESVIRTWIVTRLNMMDTHKKYNLFNRWRGNFDKNLIWWLYTKSLIQGIYAKYYLQQYGLIFFKNINTHYTTDSTLFRIGVDKQVKNSREVMIFNCTQWRLRWWKVIGNMAFFSHNSR